MARHTYESVRQYFADYNCILLSKSYISSSSLLEYQCSCGEIAKVRFNDFKRGKKNCRKCSYKKLSINSPTKLTQEYVEEYARKQGYTLLSKYKNSETKLKYICKCGNVTEALFNDIKRRKRCRKCFSQECAERYKIPFEQVEDYFSENGCILLSREYNNNRQLLDYICSCGRVSKISFNKFKLGRRCFECGKEKRTGENSGTWNPNLSDEERESKRNINGYAIWRHSVYERDNYTCQICSDAKGGNLNAHHLKSYSINKELRTETDNGITLCDDCHKLFHKIYGNRSNNKQQFEEFKMNFKAP